MSKLSFSSIEVNWLVSLLETKTPVKILETRVGSNGTTRDLMCIAYVCGEVLNISSLVAKIAEKQLNKKGDAVFIRGGGMDMSFALELNFNNMLNSAIEESGEPKFTQYTNFGHYFRFKPL